MTLRREDLPKSPDALIEMLLSADSGRQELAAENVALKADLDEACAKAVAREAENVALKAENLRLRTALDEACAKIVAQEAVFESMKCALNGEIADGKTMLATLRTMIFGRKSERLNKKTSDQSTQNPDDDDDDDDRPEDDDQIDDGTTDGIAGDAVAGNDNTQRDGKKSEGKEKKQKKKAKRNIGLLPEDFERVFVNLEPDSTICSCGKPMTKFGEDVSEMIDRLRTHFQVISIIRPKYRCQCGTEFAQASAPPRLIEHGMPTTRFVSHIAAQKYAWQSTLYRQAQIIKGQGICIDPQTLSRWMTITARWLKPLYQLLLKEIHKHGHVFCDETPITVRSSDGKTYRTCQFWAHASDDTTWRGPAPQAVAYVFAQSRAFKEIEGQLSGFEGWVQADGYAAYPKLTEDKVAEDKTVTPSGIFLANCLVHARRNFAILWKTQKWPFADEVMKLIAEVYIVEGVIRGEPAEFRCVMRQLATKPIMSRLKIRLEEVKAGGLPKNSKMSKAINYMLDRWESLTAFIDNGTLEPDTNIVERPIRSIALNKKNSLFAGSDVGAENWAIISSLLISARMNGHDPEAYLADILDRMVSGATKINALSELLPQNWVPASKRRAPSETETAAA
jgi:transposase